MNKEMRQFLKQIKSEGWTVEKQRRSGHLRFEYPGAPVVFVSGTPSDHRAFQNIRRDMRRAQQAEKQ